MISSSLIFITITILGEKLNNCSNSNTCLPYYVIPVHYHIKLNDACINYFYIYNKHNSIVDFYGESSTIINILQSTKYIKLHVLNLIIHQEKITLIKNNGVTYVLKTYIETYKTNLLELNFFNVLSPGLYTLKLEFGRSTENFSKNFFKSFYTKKENSKL